MYCEICLKTNEVKFYSFHPKLKKTYSQVGATHIYTTTYSGSPNSIAICKDCIIKAINNDMKNAFKNLRGGLIAFTALSILFYFFVWINYHEIIVIILFILVIMSFFLIIGSFISVVIFKRKLRKKIPNEDDGVCLQEIGILTKR